MVWVTAASGISIALCLGNNILGGLLTVAHPPAKVLLIEPDPALRELNALILDEAGYQVEVLPDQANPVAFAEQTHPQVIAIGVRFHEPEDEQILDRLQTNPHTRAIPVVAISSSPGEAARAAASTNVSEVVVAPYDITALENAVSSALGKPPAAAVFPVATKPAPAYQIIAADALQTEARAIVLRSVLALLRTKPYAHHFSGLSPELVDNLGLLLGSVIEGLRKDLPPDRVFAAPAIQRIIREHVRLRTQPGFGLDTIVREGQALEEQMRLALEGVISTSFSAADALAVIDKINAFIGKLVLIEIADYGQPPA